MDCLNTVNKEKKSDDPSVRIDICLKCSVTLVGMHQTDKQP